MELTHEGSLLHGLQYGLHYCFHGLEPHCFIKLMSTWIAAPHIESQVIETIVSSIFLYIIKQLLPDMPATLIFIDTKVVDIQRLYRLQIGIV